jgi:hypothetical protein
MEFAARVFLSFLIGGTYVAGIVWVSEKLGSRIGAAVTGLPSTILVGLAFIAVLQGTEAAQTALKLVPLMFTATLIYAILFIAGLKLARSAFQNTFAILLGTLGWLLTVLVIRTAIHLPFALIAVASVCSLFIFWLAFKQLSHDVHTRVILPKSAHLIRFLIGGFVIAGAVIASHYSGPAWGGIIASFPGMLGVILYFVNKSQGIKFAEGFLKSLPLSYFGSFTFIVVVYATITRITPLMSFILGLLSAMSYMLVMLKLTRKRV